MKVEQQNQQEISRWSRFQNSQMWKRVVAELQLRLEDADKIVNMIGGDAKAEFSKRDLALMQKKEIQALIDLPQENIETLLGTGSEPIEEMDAFEENVFPNSNLIEEPEEDF